MTAYAELRRRVAGWPKPEGCRAVRRAPLVTPGFPGTFNLSYTEHHWLAEYASLVDWTHDLAFSTVQSCVRLRDLDELAGPRGVHYLGTFELADLGGVETLVGAADRRALVGRRVGDLVALLGELGVAPERLHPSWCAGGPVAELTGGRYVFDHRIPPDDASRDAFLAAGVPARNLIPDRTRDTLLSLHVHRPTPWGYRNEVLVDLGGTSEPRRIDVATVEQILWRPRFRAGSSRREDLCGLSLLPGGAFIAACGLERVALAAAGLARVHDVDPIRPLYDGLARELGRPLSATDYRLGEALRVLHRIESDLRHHPECERSGPDAGSGLSRHRRKALAPLKRTATTSLDAGAIERLLRLHASAQPWHEELADGVDATVESVERYRAARPAPSGFSSGAGSPS